MPTRPDGTHSAILHAYCYLIFSTHFVQPGLRAELLGEKEEEIEDESIATESMTTIRFKGIEEKKNHSNKVTKLIIGLSLHSREFCKYIQDNILLDRLGYGINSSYDEHSFLGAVVSV